MDLLLLIRQDCCLCESLAKRLQSLSLPFAIVVVNVDFHPRLQAIYMHRVPILIQRFNNELGLKDHELPSISPRLGGINLTMWLKRNILSW
uniref:Glutaredoxin-like protein n=1 Tax=Paulinella longichromatophora TaxID=1708747 RepID=A0A2H4ZQH1_9EUKA|nr:ribonucleotide reductase (Class II) [Paulinella longichromatophora]